MERITYANFGIQKVRKDTNGNIDQLLVYRRESDDSLTYLDWYSKQSIINHMEDGNTYMTISISDGYWYKGDDIHVVSTSWGKYLRTDGNHLASDNLGNLPEV